ncbi:hypothetical protein SUDANB95_04899 [Actinosynnema sp. ALI-1.44]
MTTVPAQVVKRVHTAVSRAFHGAELCSAMAGSTVAGTVSATSDIDVVVVLPDRLPLRRAVTAREHFTQQYVALHKDLGRTPDLEWPGEVLYAGDAVAGMRGAAFDLSAADEGLVMSAAEEPYRYWISMIATGHAATGGDAFERCARWCAHVMARHVLLSGPVEGRVDRPLTPSVATVLRSRAWSEDWGLGEAEVRGRLAEAVSREVRQLRERGVQDLLEWRDSLRNPSSRPVLDEDISRWRDVARAAHLGGGTPHR